MSFPRNHDYTRGSRNPNALMTETDVVALREACAAGIPQHEMAARYGISASMVSRVVRGLDWAHAGGPIKKTIVVWEVPETPTVPLTH